MLHHCNLRQLGTGTPIHLPIVTSDTCGQLLDHWTSPQFWKYSLRSSQICLLLQLTARRGSQQGRDCHYATSPTSNTAANACGSSGPYSLRLSVHENASR